MLRFLPWLKAESAAFTTLTTVLWYLLTISPSTIHVGCLPYNGTTMTQMIRWNACLLLQLLSSLMRSCLVPWLYTNWTVVFAAKLVGGGMKYKGFPHFSYWYYYCSYNAMRMGCLYVSLNLCRFHRRIHRRSTYSQTAVVVPSGWLAGVVVEAHNINSSVACL